ncbi:hypothetical protein Lal_00026219 [Lupinus albus]|nr:hypothetical protein Lal_00026219 [Lupinus albus]
MAFSNNILYPKEDKEHKILLYGCRNCDHEALTDLGPRDENKLLWEVADNNIVYRNKIHHSDRERIQGLQNVAADPTLPRTKSVRCAQCNHGEAVFYQRFNKAIHQGTAPGEEGMTLFFVCCNPNCGNRWRD